MNNRKRLFKNDDGAASIVEYAIVLPLCFFVIMFIFLLGFFLSEKAVVESAGQRGVLVAMKMYNDPSADLIYDYRYGTDNNTAGFGKSASTFGTMNKDPYRYWTRSYRQSSIDTSVRDYVTEAITKSQLGIVKRWAKTPQVSYTPSGGLLGNNICVSVEQEYQLLPIIFERLLGIKSTTIKVDCYMNIINQTEFIRNTDFVCDLIEMAGGGKILDKVTKAMDAITTFFKGKPEGKE